MRARMIFSGVLTVGCLVAGLVAMPSASAEPSMNNVRTATSAFHSIKSVERAGYTPFLDCFDDPSGGMGQHYVSDALLNDGGAVDAEHPEAMVYEVKGGKLTLVAVEWIVNQADVSEPPMLFGDVHFHAFGPFYVLHAWVWKDNPNGVFADWNPDVAACPA